MDILSNLHALFLIISFRHDSHSQVVCDTMKHIYPRGVSSADQKFYWIMIFPGFPKTLCLNAMSKFHTGHYFLFFSESV